MSSLMHLYPMCKNLIYLCLICALCIVSVHIIPLLLCTHTHLCVPQLSICCTVYTHIVCFGMIYFCDMYSYCASCACAAVGIVCRMSLKHIRVCLICSTPITLKLQNNGSRCRICLSNNPDTQIGEKNGT